MTKKQINVKEFLTNIRGGLDDASLMEKHGLSERGLRSLFRKLVEAGYLDQAELDGRASLSAIGVKKDVFLCPECGNPLRGPGAPCRSCSDRKASEQETIDRVHDRYDRQASPRPRGRSHKPGGGQVGQTIRVSAGR